jgi:hypothetical protein
MSGILINSGTPQLNIVNNLIRTDFKNGWGIYFQPGVRAELSPTTSW